MIITANEMAMIQRQPARTETRAVLYEFEGGTITAKDLSKRVGMTVDAVRKRLRNQTADELMAEGRRKAKWKSK